MAASNGEWATVLTKNYIRARQTPGFKDNRATAPKPTFIQTKPHHKQPTLYDFIKVHIH